MAINLFAKPMPEFIAFAAEIAIVRLFWALLSIISAVFEIFDESVLYLFIIF